MKLDGWHIDGYGVHADLAVRDLPRGLTVVHGPNESGKTTLQHFLVGMLFGFSASNRPDHHAPLRGGSYGGRLFVTDATGRPLTISRGARRSSLHISGPDGDIAEGELAQLLGGATKDLYQSIFAVHTEEVAELRALTDDQVRDRVFSAGILGAGRTAQQALGQLADGRDALLKPGGRGDKYLLKQLRTDLVAARSALTAAQQQALGLPTLLADLARLEQVAAGLAGQADALRDEQALLTAVTEVWATWARAVQARRELAALGPVPDLADDVRQRIHQAEQAVAERASVFADLEAQRDAARQEADALPAPGPIVDHQPAIAELAAGASAEDERLARIAALEPQVDDRAATLDATLRRLGPGCDRRWLAAQPVDLEADAQMRTLATAVTEARRANHQATTDLATAKRELADDAAQLDAEEAALATAPAIPADRARAGVEQALRLVTLVDQRQAAHQRLVHARDAAQAGREAAAAAPGLPGWARPALLAVAGAALAGGGIAVASGATVAGLLGLAIAIAIVGLAIALGTTRPEAAPTTVDATATDHATADLARLDQELAPVLRALGLERPPVPAEAAALLASAERIADAAAAGAAEQRHLAQRRQALDDRRTRLLERLRADHAATEAQLHQAMAAWQGWLTARDLPITLDAEGAAEHQRTLAQARDLLHDLERDQAELARLTAASAAYADAVGAIAAQLPEHLGHRTPPTPVAVARHLDAEAHTHLERQQRQTTAATELARAERAVADAAARHQAAADELTAALAAIGAQDLDHARDGIARADRAAALQAEIDHAELALTTAIGTEPTRVAAAHRLLDLADPAAWSQRLDALRQELASTTAERDDAIKASALAQQEVDALRRSADVPRLELAVADLEAQLADAVREWAALTVAHQLVEGTLARYQRERQPHVVQRAAALFAQITEGRYPQLQVRDRDLIAIDRTGREVPAAALSRGTLEQLYLCMRFGLAESFAATAPLPLLLDDVTINADGERSPRLAQAIATVAAHQQVLVFTCHAETVAQLTANAPDARVIELPSSASTATETAEPNPRSGTGPFGVAG
ncbi:MAG: AAA family ATPase [Acidimicrobiales bacterium]